MGKMGTLLRQKKDTQVKYTFTREELRRHDQNLLREHTDRIKAECTEKIKAQAQMYEEDIRKAVEEEWKKREEILNSGDRNEDFFLLLQYTLSIAVRVLVEKFGWTPEKVGHYDKRLNINKLADYFVDEITSICSDEFKDIRKYAEDTYQKYGVRFEFKQVEVKE